MSTIDDLHRSQLQEIRRGSTVLATLAILSDAQYGYALIDSLRDAGFEIEANTLYPLLRRLEKQGLLESVWNTDESRPRKYYRTTQAGEELRLVLLDEWNRITDALNAFERSRHDLDS